MHKDMIHEDEECSTQLPSGTPDSFHLLVPNFSGIQSLALRILARNCTDENMAPFNTYLMKDYGNLFFKWRASQE